MNNKKTPYKFLFRSLFILLALNMGYGEKPKKGSPSERGSRIEMLDVDKDGSLSLEEFSALPKLEGIPEEAVSKMFTHLDKDGNASLTKEELRFNKHHSPERRKERLVKMDTNGDEKISKEEFFQNPPPHLSTSSEERKEKLFSMMDTNADGFLTPEDRREGHKREGKGPRGFFKPFQKGQRGEHSPAMPKERLEKLDLNGSGDVSLEEFRKGKHMQSVPAERQEKAFNYLDKNQDGVISPDDRPDGY